MKFSLFLLFIALSWSACRSGHGKCADCPDFKKKHKASLETPVSDYKKT